MLLRVYTISIHNPKIAVVALGSEHINQIHRKTLTVSCRRFKYDAYRWGGVMDDGWRSPVLTSEVGKSGSVSVAFCNFSISAKLFL